MVVADGSAEGVDGAGDEPHVGVARVPFGAGAQDNPNQTAAPAPPRQRARAYGRPRGLSTSGVYEVCLKSSPGRPFLAEGVVYLSGVCCTGIDLNLRGVTWLEYRVLCYLVPGRNYPRDFGMSRKFFCFAICVVSLKTALGSGGIRKYLRDNCVLQTSVRLFDVQPPEISRPRVGLKNVSKRHTTFRTLLCYHDMCAQFQIDWLVVLVAQLRHGWSSTRLELFGCY